MQVNLRNNLRAWLGLDVMPTAAMLNAAELRAQQRHEAQMGMLNRIEQRLINAHVERPVMPFTPPNLDWETVQAMALAALERDTPKEN
jgi:hypothetical protein